MEDTSPRRSTSKLRAELSVRVAMCMHNGGTLAKVLQHYQGALFTTCSNHCNIPASSPLACITLLLLCHVQ